MLGIGLAVHKMCPRPQGSWEVWSAGPWGPHFHLRPMWLGRPSTYNLHYLPALKIGRNNINISISAFD